MKKIIISITAAFFVLSLSAQDPVFKWGPLMEKTDQNTKFEDVKLYGGTAEGCFVVSTHMPAYDNQSILISVFNPIVSIEYFDKLSQRSFTRNATPARSDDYVGSVYFNDALYVITSNYSKDEGKNTLLAKGVLRGGADAKPVMIGKISGPKMSQRGKFEVAASPDGSKLLVISQQEYVKDQNEKCTFTLFGKDFSQIWEKDITYDFAWSKNAANKPNVNNNGIAYIYKVIDAKGSDDRYSIFTYNGTALKEHKIFPDPEKRITSTVQGFSPEGDFAFAGYFGNGKKFRLDIGAPVMGTFLYRIDATGQQMNAAAVNTFDGVKKGLMMKDLVFTGKDVIICSERYNVSDKAATPTTPGASMFNRDYTYSSGEMYFDKLDETGKPVFSSSLIKDINGTNDMNFQGGVLPAVAKGKLHLLFNDYKSRYGTRWVVINPPNVIVHNTMDIATGKMDNAMYVETPGPVGDKKADSWFRPATYYKIDETHYIVRAESFNQLRMGIVTIQ